MCADLLRFTRTRRPFHTPSDTCNGPNGLLTSACETSTAPSGDRGSFCATTRPRLAADGWAKRTLPTRQRLAASARFAAPSFLPTSRGTAQPALTTAKGWVSFFAAAKFAVPGCRAVIVHVPTRVRCTREPRTVHAPRALKTTRSPESAVARRLKSRWPNLMSTSGSKSIVCPVFAIENVCDTDGAALKFASPGCAAVTVHEPAPVMCTATPLTVQLPVALNVTPRADDVNASTLKFGSPNVAFLIASNWMID